MCVSFKKIYWAVHLCAIYIDKKLENLYNTKWQEKQKTLLKKVGILTIKYEDL